MADSIEKLSARLAQQMVDHVAVDVAVGETELSDRMIALTFAGLRVAISVQTWSGTSKADAMRRCRDVLTSWLAAIEGTN